jgi:hypothetical protein
MIFIVDGDDYSVLGSFAAPDWGGNGNQHFGAAMAVGNNRLYVGAPQWRSGNDHYGIVYLFNIAAGGVTYTGNTRTDWQRFRRGPRGPQRRRVRRSPVRPVQ